MQVAEVFDAALLRALLDDLAGGPAAAAPAGVSGPQALRDTARALQRAMGGIYFADLAPHGGGPICAIDIDGVLEAEVAGIPVLTPAGALALRALHAHGFSPIVATGRSVDQVRDRCASYGLAGGVAEYGSAYWLPQTAIARSLVPPAARKGFERVRAYLAGVEDVVIDGRYTHVVRAYHPGIAARPRRELYRPITIAALDAAEPLPLRAVPAGTQTDFVASSIDKATGLRAFLGGRRLAFAIGDTIEDVAMLALAERPFAPANAADAIGAAGVTVMPGSCQIGFAQAVGELLGHPPGECRGCRLPTIRASAQPLLAALSAIDQATACDSPA